MKRTWIRVCFVPLAFLVVEATAFGQDPQETPPFMTLDISRSEVPLEFGLAITDAEAEFRIDVDRLALVDNPTVLTLGLYEGVRLEAHRFMSRPYVAQGVDGVVDSWTSWTGNLYFPDLLGADVPAGVVMLNDHGSHITGMIQVDATLEDFQIVGNSKGEHRLIRMKRVRRPSCALQGEVKTSSGSTPGPSTDSLMNSQSARVDSRALMLDDEVEIKVLAIIPDTSGGAIDFIEDSLSWANSIFAYSGMSTVSYELAILGNISTIPQKDDVIEYLHWMNTTAGRSQIEMFRDSTFFHCHADMVVLLVQPPLEQPWCGAANLRYWNGQRDAVYDNVVDNLDWDTDEPAYSVGVVGCGLNDYTFAHELGHNFGLRHDVTDHGEDEDDWGYTPIDNDPRGHEFATYMGPRATVMGCWGEFAPCYRTPYYSDPDLIWGGYYPTGNRNDPYNADVVNALENHVVEYSLFR
ncbi:MAG: M12 family metallo-peptidase [Acidobacteriota bacterium]